MSKEESASDIESVKDLKKQLVMFRLKLSQGETISINDYRAKKKEVARILTKLNKVSK